MTTFTESIIEQAAIDWLSELGYEYAFGPEIAFDGAHPERSDYQEPLLYQRLQVGAVAVGLLALGAFPPHVPSEPVQRSIPNERFQSSR